MTNANVDPDGVVDKRALKGKIPMTNANANANANADGPFLIAKMLPSHVTMQWLSFSM